MSAATALALGLPVLTQDDDYTVLAGLGDPDLIRV
jgi:predicted nucleic acid-binding protein